MEIVIGAAARVLVICLLTTSALEKLRAGEGIRQVLRTLGARPVALWWLVLCCAELLGSAVMVTPGPRWLSSAVVLSLGVAFALAGARAVRMRADIRCACFGQLGDRGQLGWRQIRSLPLWFVLAVALLPWQPAGTDQRIMLIYAAIVAMLAFYMFRLTRAMAVARANRMALVVPEGVDPSRSSLLRLRVPAAEVRALGPAAVKEVA